MGRTKYSAEERKTVAASFIKATASIIATDGIGNVSIRKVATQAGYSSATLYLYFKDLSELIKLATVSYLRDYVKDLQPKDLEEASNRERYIRTWEVFCDHAFKYPSVFMQLFFGYSSQPLGEVVKEYYSIFPRELDDIDGTMLTMLTRGNLIDRNLAVFDPLAEELKFDDHTRKIINELTVASFRDHLQQACDAAPHDIDVEQLKSSFMDTVDFLLGYRSK